MKKYGIDAFDWVFELFGVIVIYSLAVSNLNYIFEWNLSGIKMLLLILTIMMLNVRQLKNILITEKMADKIILKSDKDVK